MIKKLIILIFILFLSATNSLADWSDLVIRVSDWSEKYRQSDSVSAQSTLTIKCAKNEFEPFLVWAYNAGGTDLTGVNITVTESGGTFAYAPDISSTDDEGFWIYKADYITASTASRGDYSTGDWPEILIPKKDIYYNEERSWSSTGVTIAAGETQLFWVDIGTRDDTAAGVYTFNVAVTKSGESNKTATVTLQVWDFTLPNQFTLRTQLGIDLTKLDTQHGVSYNYGSSDMASHHKKYVELFLYHGMGIGEYMSHLEMYTTVDGNNEVDSWTNWETAFKDALDGTLIANGPYAGKILSGIIVEYVAGTSNRDDNSTEFEAYLTSWHDKFTTNGWNPNERLFVLTYDEPDGDTYTYRGSSHIDYQMISEKAKSVRAVDANWMGAYTTEQYRAQWEIKSGGAPNSGDIDSIDIDYPNGDVGSGSFWNFASAANWATSKFDIEFTTGNLNGQSFTVDASDGNTIDLLGDDLYQGGSGAVAGDRFKTIGGLEYPGTGYTGFGDSGGIYIPPGHHYTYRTLFDDGSMHKHARENYPNNGDTDYQQWNKRGHWAYVACGHHDCGGVGNAAKYANMPDLMIETPPILTRTLMWIWWFYRVHGFLYWHANNSDDPWDSIYAYGGNGGGQFVYPGLATLSGRSGQGANTPAIGGTNDIPLAGIRLKILREAIEDREYFEIARKAGYLNQVDTYVNGVFTDTDDSDDDGCPYFCTSTDESDFNNARTNIAGLIEVPDRGPKAPVNLRISSY